MLLLFALVTEALSRATAALLEENVALAEGVIADDNAIDRRCDELIGLIKEGLAQAAEDPEELECLIDILQMIPELERSADLAEHIARRTLKGLGGIITARSRGLIQSMSDAAVGMWQVAAAAYQSRSRDAGFQLADADDQLDQQAAMLVSQGAQAADPNIAADLALIARFYERLGDHAVNLARRVDTMVAPRRLSTPRFGNLRRSGRAPDGQAEPDGRGGLWGRIRRMRFAPTNDEFFGLFRSAAANAREAADELSKLTISFSDIDEHCNRIRALERAGDQVTIDVLRRLDASFVTPYDREDIHELAEELDDVVDHIFAAASLIQLAGVDEPLPELGELTALLVNMTDELVALMGGLRSGQGARYRLERIEHLEREGDMTVRHAMGRLFSGEYDPLDVIKWKDIVQALEDSLNAIEDVSNVVESILVKNS